MRVARKVPQSTGAAVSGSTDEPPAQPAQQPPHDPEVWGTITRCPVRIQQTSSGQRLNEPKLQSPSAKVQSLADEAEAILWNSSQQINSTRRTVALNILYIFECIANINANVLLKAHQSEPNQMNSRLAKFSLKLTPCHQKLQQG